MVKVTILDSGPEKNELNQNANGGTELMQNELYKRLDKDLLDNFQIICSRVRKIKDKQRILWCHDLADDGEVAHLKDEGWKNFDKLVFVSNWQFQDYINKLDIPWSSGVVLQNAITPIPEHEKPDDEINLVYFSTPHRGLEILVPVFEQMHNEHFKTLDKPVNLHVYSSFELYGWKERDEQYKEVLQKCREHSNIFYHGSVPNDVIHYDLQKMHILAYPNVWPETSCIVLMEAMSAGLSCVHPNYAGLPETAANWTMMYHIHEEGNAHAQMFAQQLFNACKLVDDPAVLHRNRMQKQYADAFYSWDGRAVQWRQFLESMLDES